MANATIVQLGSANFGAPATTFEQEFSEARGRGRARRQARRTDRAKKRSERKSQRQALRQGRKAERQKRRADMRDTRRARREESRNKRNESRLARRQRRQEARQMRRDTKADAELSRDARAMEQEEMMNERYADEPIDDAGYEDEGGYAEEGGYDEGGYDEGAYAEEGGYDDEGGYDEEGGDYGDEEGGYDEGYEFDGDNYEFFDDSEGETPFDFADGSGVQVAPAVQDVANRIEWNKELCCRLRDKAASGQMPQAMAQDEIAKSVERIDELKSCLDAWCNFEGEFMSDAKGGVQFKKTDAATRAKLANKFKRKERIMALRAALAKAKNDRKRVAVKPISGKRAGLSAAMSKRGGLKQNVTNVEMGLAPKIGNQKIVIPARVSNADGTPTGIIGVDDAGDIDSRYTEVKLGADGDKTTTSKIPMKPILIAVGVGALIAVGYYFMKKK